MKYIFLIIFAVLIYTEEKINNSEAAVSMLSCDTLEKSNSPYIKSKNQKEILTVWFWFRRKSWKRAEAMTKVFMS